MISHVCVVFSYSRAVVLKNNTFDYILLYSTIQYNILYYIVLHYYLVLY